MDQGEAIYPVAAWALIDNKVTGLIAVADRNLSRVPLGEIAYKTRQELSKAQITLIGLGSIGHEPELIQQITDQVDLFLDDQAASITYDQKEQVITLLYAKEMKDKKWREEVGLGEAGQL
jgi:hypothetical protein